MTRIAALLACFNRKVTTLEGLRRLAAARLPEGVCLDVFLLDDASTDGTAAAVAAEFPAVHVLSGTGDLFWGGGMREAFAEAMKADFDFYLWLNDDVVLHADAFDRILACYRGKARQADDAMIVVGATCDPQYGHLTYGGRVRQSWHPLRFDLVPPDAIEPRSCEAINGNIVLISRRAAKIVGNIDETFSHQMGDLDYGLRAHKLGVPIWIAPGYCGACARQARDAGWKDPNASLRQRLKLVRRKRGLPLKEWLTFCWRHGGILGVLTGLFGYRELFFPRRQP